MYRFFGETKRRFESVGQPRESQIECCIMNLSKVVDKPIKKDLRTSNRNIYGSSDKYTGVIYLNLGKSEGLASCSMA